MTIPWYLMVQFIIHIKFPLVPRTILGFYSKFYCLNSYLFANVPIINNENNFFLIFHSEKTINRNYFNSRISFHLHNKGYNTSCHHHLDPS